jgi:hypothetical protein
MAVMLALYLLAVVVIVPFVTEQVDHWTYGEQRLSQFDFDVGHGGISHFLAEYWHGQIVVIEMPQHHLEQSKTYLFAVSTGEDKSGRVITLRPAYINPRGIPGKPDIAVQIEGQTIERILYNTGDGFRVGV